MSLCLRIVIRVVLCSGPGLQKLLPLAFFSFHFPMCAALRRLHRRMAVSWPGPTLRYEARIGGQITAGLLLCRKALRKAYAAAMPLQPSMFYLATSRNSSVSCGPPVPGTPLTLSAPPRQSRSRRAARPMRWASRTACAARAARRRALCSGTARASCVGPGQAVVSFYGGGRWGRRDIVWLVEGKVGVGGDIGRWWVARQWDSLGYRGLISGGVHPASSRTLAKQRINCRSGEH